MENKINEKEFLNLKEAGELLGLSRQTISGFTKLKDFPSTKLKRRILINKNRLLDWIKTRKNVEY